MIGEKIIVDFPRVMKSGEKIKYEDRPLKDGSNNWYNIEVVRKVKPIYIHFTRTGVVYKYVCIITDVGNSSEVENENV